MVRSKDTALFLYSTSHVPSGWSHVLVDRLYHVQYSEDKDNLTPLSTQMSFPVFFFTCILFFRSVLDKSNENRSPRENTLQFSPASMMLVLRSSYPAFIVLGSYNS